MKISIPSVVVSELSVPSLDFRQSAPYIEQQQATRRTGRTTGMIFGGITGFLVGGPVGAMIGASVGRGGGGSLAGDGVDALQLRLQALAAADIAEYFDRYEAAIHAAVDRVANNVLEQFRSAGKRHVSEFGAAAADLVRRHEQARATLVQAIHDARTDADELTNRSERLKALRQRLASKGK
jgi:hypothetical protein